MNYLISWFTDNSALIGAAMAAGLLIIFILLLSLAIRLSRLTKAHKSLMSGNSGKNLEELLDTYLAKVKSAETRVEELDFLCHKLEESARKSLQNVSLVRFNAFDNMGSDLSFAAAFLDLNGDGLVISSINNREESRVYAKPIASEKSKYHLSEEEIQAIKKAMERSK